MARGGAFISRRGPGEGYSCTRRFRPTVDPETERTALGFLPRAHLAPFAPGGVLVDAPLPNGADTLREFLSKLACSVPTVPFLALREEGGPMDPLGVFLPPLPSPRAAAGKGLAAVQRLGELVGAALKLLGFNTDLAPRSTSRRLPREKGVVNPLRIRVGARHGVPREM